MHRAGISIAILVGGVVLGGCNRTTRADAATVVDSVVPRAAALDRFRSGLSPVESLSGAERSRDALVRQFVRAAEHRDTAALQRMVMSRAEYAWLYYPTNPQGLPPYDLSPSLLWFLIDGRNTQGLGHLMQERWGQALHVARYTCDPQPSIEGENRIWGPCMLYRVQAPGDTIAERLFGPIIERAGRFKFVSYANKL